MALPPLPTVGGDFGAWGTILNTYLLALADDDLAYNQITSNVSITATTGPTANTVVTASAVTFDGTTVALIEFSAAVVLKGTTYTRIVLYDGATELGVMSQASIDTAVHPAVRLTPSAAAHTYSIRAYVDAGTGTVAAGSGAAGQFFPAFIKITRLPT